MPTAAMRDLRWRWKRFHDRRRWVSLVFAMGLLMTGLSESFSVEVDRTLDAIGAEAWAACVSASGSYTSFVPMRVSVAGPTTLR